MSPTERRALLLLLALGLAGQGLRWWVGRPGEPPGQVELLAALPPKSPRAHRDSILALARPLESGERVDADRAAAPELARLPKVGLHLAKAIVADREAKGPFGSLDGLDRVPGIGPGLLSAIAPHLTFSSAAGSAFAPASGQFARPGPPVRGGSPISPESPRPSLVNLNTATLSDLDNLPGIGPARAAAILQEREARGPFASVEALARVPGLGPAAIARLRDRVVVP